MVHRQLTCEAYFRAEVGTGSGGRRDNQPFGGGGGAAVSVRENYPIDCAAVYKFAEFARASGASFVVSALSTDAFCVCVCYLHLPFHFG